MWTLDAFPRTVKIEVTLEDLAKAGPTEAFNTLCKARFGEYVFSPNVKTLELKIYELEAMELVAVYRLPEVARSLFASVHYRPRAVTLMLGRLKVR